MEELRAAKPSSTPGSDDEPLLKENSRRFVLLRIQYEGMQCEGMQCVGMQCVGMQ